MLDQEFDKIHHRDGFANEDIVFMTVIVESNLFAVIRIDTVQSDNRAAEVTGDVFDHGFGITEVGFGVDIETIFIFTVNMCFYLFKRRTDVSFHQVQECCLKSGSQVGKREMFYDLPETVIGETAFCNEAVDVWVPFQRASESM